MIKNLTLIMLLFVGSYAAFAQTEKQKEAYKIAMEAIKIMDAGQIDESIKMLEKAAKLDPDNYNYPYEIAYAHCAKQDYKGAIKLLEKLEKHKDATDQLYQLLGNSYDLVGNSEKAFEVYDRGLKKFPKSGKLYLEKGNVHWGKKEYNEALPYYEKGIEVEPGFPSNYYRATLLYCSSSERIWGVLYGEIFMNLERNSQRTAEISKLLYDTYQAAITIDSDTSGGVSFSKNMNIQVDANDPENFKMPFAMMYEPTMMIAMTAHIGGGAKTLKTDELCDIRSNFISAWYEQNRDKDHPNVLFDFNKTVMENGYLDAYNHWILMQGEEGAFEKWREANEEQWTAFAEWFNKNPMVVDDKHKFSSGQY